MHEPGGCTAANDEALAAAAGSAGRLVAFCRLDPNDGDRAVAQGYPLRATWLSGESGPEPVDLPAVA